MRTIKFRGKRIDNGELVTGSLVMVCDGETLKRYPCIVISYNHDAFDWHEVNPETVGQFTGLVDRNGREIWEGDRVNTTHSIIKTGVIEYWKVYHSFEITDENGNGCIGDKYDWSDIEVIGNINDTKPAT